MYSYQKFFMLYKQGRALEVVKKTVVSIEVGNSGVPPAVASCQGGGTRAGHTRHSLTLAPASHWGISALACASRDVPQHSLASAQRRAPPSAPPPGPDENACATSREI